MDSDSDQEMVEANPVNPAEANPVAARPIANPAAPQESDESEDDDEDPGEPLELEENGSVSHFAYDYQDRHLVNNIKCLFNSPQMSDVVFLLYDENSTNRHLKPVFAHRYVLAACSPFFRTLFNTNCVLGTKSCKILMTGIRFKLFLHIIRYVYVGWVEDTFPMHEAAEFYRTAKGLGLEDLFHWNLRTWMMNCVRQRIDSTVAIYLASYEHHFVDIVQECLIAMTDNPREVMDDKNFKKIPIDAMLLWLRRPRMNCEKRELLEAVERWITANAEDEDEDGKDEVRRAVQETDYKCKGQRYRLRTEPGIPASFMDDDDEDMMAGDQIATMPVLIEDKEYNFYQSCEMIFEESVFVYGVVMLFGKHKYHDDRYDESDFCGQFEIRNEDFALVNESFKGEINFTEQNHTTIEIFFAKTPLTFNQAYIFEVNWRAVGPYPDVLTFDTHQSSIRVHGNVFISEILFEPQFRE